jgi:hypothetical protein
MSSMEVKEIDHSSMRTISFLKGQQSSAPSEAPFPSGYFDNEETPITLRQRYESVREEKARRGRLQELHAMEKDGKEKLKVPQVHNVVLWYGVCSRSCPKVMLF